MSINVFSILTSTDRYQICRVIIGCEGILSRNVFQNESVGVKTLYYTDIMTIMAFWIKYTMTNDREL